MSDLFDSAAALSFIKNANRLIDEGVKEDVLRHELSARLPKIFPDSPWWVKYHSMGSEETLKFLKSGKAATGFVDTLVGATAIEYEKNLKDPTIFEHGQAQVKDYCAGLLNQGVPTENVVGILSDTIRWRAYRVKKIQQPFLTAEGSTLGRDDISLEEIDGIDLSKAETNDIEKLRIFLTQHLGRFKARIVSAQTLAFDLGFESPFCERHISAIRELVDRAFLEQPEYANLVEKVWSDFVSFLGSSSSSGTFDRDTYISELYILTLAKLFCANVLEGTALSSNDSDLTKILDGSYFQAKGFSNLVEYDYFGWLNHSPHVNSLLPIAREIQIDLAAYDFSAAPVEDVFGGLLSQLAQRSQRLLLGQEWTPAWLARRLVKQIFDEIKPGDDPRLVDMCCGSGAMVVEVVKQSILRMESAGEVPSAANIARLSNSVTGFDIDPLAVMLAKVSWILAARSWIKLAGSFDVSIPIYHADSLFISTPLAKKVDSSNHLLDFDGRKVVLPSFLVSPTKGSFFDAVLDHAYEVAMTAAALKVHSGWAGVADDILKKSMEQTNCDLSDAQKSVTSAFINELLIALEDLQRSGRNGIWAFVLRNSYRPGLVAGRFNGLVSNPPWLAMSKIGNNPYKESLDEMSIHHGIKPQGAAHLHAELATIFLLHSIGRYLAPDARVACVLPESVLSAHNHNPFRLGSYFSATKAVSFSPDEIWRVAKGTFKNEAIVLFGSKSGRAAAPTMFKGNLVSSTQIEPLTFSVITQGKRTAWSESSNIQTGGAGFFKPAEFRQGADLFPRTVIFHEVSKVGVRYDLARIDRASSKIAYLVKDAKKNKDFSLTVSGIDKKYLFDVLTSNQLTPFDLSYPVKALLPIERSSAGVWAHSPEVTIASSGPSTMQAFRAFFEAVGIDSKNYFEYLDTERHKLSSQHLPAEGWLVVMGAGGSVVCAAHASMTDFNVETLILDQTLYWVVVSSEDEALYLAGLLNSDAVNTVIKEFQPRGQFGERHVHTLPLGATPPFNPLDPSHLDVAARTRQLLFEWNSLKLKKLVNIELFNPNYSKLAGRRATLRALIQALPAYAEYEIACKSIYGV